MNDSNINISHTFPQISFQDFPAVTNENADQVIDKRNAVEEVLVEKGFIGVTLFSGDFTDTKPWAYNLRVLKIMIEKEKL